MRILIWIASGYALAMTCFNFTVIARPRSGRGNPDSYFYELFTELVGFCLLRTNNKKTAVQTSFLSALCLMGIQALVVVLVSLAWGWHSFQCMTSSLLGGFISIAPNAYFARRFFNSGNSSDPRKIIRTFYIGEILKLIIMVVLAIIIFTQLSVLVLPFLSGLVAATLGLWFSPLLLSFQRNARVATS